LPRKGSWGERKHPPGEGDYPKVLIPVKSDLTATLYQANLLTFHGIESGPLWFRLKTQDPLEFKGEIGR